jgi:hypothetical protein
MIGCIWLALCISFQLLLLSHAWLHFMGIFKRVLSNVCCRYGVEWIAAVRRGCELGDLRAVSASKAA